MQTLRECPPSALPPVCSHADARGPSRVPRTPPRVPMASVRRASAAGGAPAHGGKRQRSFKGNTRPAQGCTDQSPQLPFSYCSPSPHQAAPKAGIGPLPPSSSDCPGLRENLIICQDRNKRNALKRKGATAQGRPRGQRSRTAPSSPAPAPVPACKTGAQTPVLAWEDSQMGVCGLSPPQKKAGLGDAPCPSTPPSGSRSSAPTWDLQLGKLLQDQFSVVRGRRALGLAAVKGRNLNPASASFPGSPSILHC